jgi:branched-subunit amino acid aminotransferase/4-amino-4-deoxychorismate lyase
MSAVTTEIVHALNSYLTTYFGMIGSNRMSLSTSSLKMKPNHKRSIQESLAYVDGRWCPTNEATLSLDDWGVLQGVMLVERLRTYNGTIFQIERHLARLRDSVESVGLNWNRWANFDIPTICEKVAANALECVTEGADIGLVILATPGRLSSQQPTRIIHAGELPWKRLADWYTNGQDLITSSIRNVPSECWPVSVKTRSRLHYYLADQQAAAKGPNVGALMLGLGSQVTETSFANVMMVDHRGTIIAPRRDEVLPGISLDIAIQLAEEIGIETRFETIDIETFRKASEIILTGTNGGIWGARSLDGVAIPWNMQDSVLRKLQQQWRNLVDTPFIEQAQRLGN